MSAPSPNANRSDSPDKRRSHVHYRELLERHIDGELGAEERNELFEHLEFCDECRETLEAEERLLDRLSQIPRLQPPSDLRASILRQVERERAEMSRLMNEEEQYAPLFDGPGEAETWTGRGVAPIRRRTLWQRVSPVAATLFLVAASLGALMTGDFSQVKPLAAAQTSLHRAVAFLARSTGLSARDNAGGEAPVRVIADAVRPAAPKALPDDAPLSLDGFKYAGRRLNAYARSRVEQMDRVARQLAEASRFETPPPAEHERATLAAIVLKPTTELAAEGTDPDAFGREIRQTALSDNRTPTADDQFVTDGHRYRCYVLRVSDHWLDHMNGHLQAYRRPAEAPVIRVLGEQGHREAKAENVAFFAAPGNVIREAVNSYHASPTISAAGREVRVYLVD